MGDIAFVIPHVYDHNHANIQTAKIFRSKSYINNYMRF